MAKHSQHIGNFWEIHSAAMKLSMKFETNGYGIRQLFTAESFNLNLAPHLKLRET